MIEFEVYIDESFAFSLRADGLIVSTPTGSTAYSLSGGGPILSPSLNAISLVPMFPHTLSSRPLVVDGNRRIKLLVSPENRGTQEVSCDGKGISACFSGRRDPHLPEPECTQTCSSKRLQLLPRSEKQIRLVEQALLTPVTLFTNAGIHMPAF